MSREEKDAIEAVLTCFLSMLNSGALKAVRLDMQFEGEEGVDVVSLITHEDLRGKDETAKVMTREFIEDIKPKSELLLAGLDLSRAEAACAPDEILAYPSKAIH